MLERRHLVALHPIMLERVVAHLAIQVAVARLRRLAQLVVLAAGGVAAVGRVHCSEGKQHAVEVTVVGVASCDGLQVVGLGAGHVAAREAERRT